MSSNNSIKKLLSLLQVTDNSKVVLKSEIINKCALILFKSIADFSQNSSINKEGLSEDRNPGPAVNSIETHSHSDGGQGPRKGKVENEDENGDLNLKKDNDESYEAEQEIRDIIRLIRESCLRKGDWDMRVSSCFILESCVELLIAKYENPNLLWIEEDELNEEVQRLNFDLHHVLNSGNSLLLKGSLDSFFEPNSENDCNTFMSENIEKEFLEINPKDHDDDSENVSSNKNNDADGSDATNRRRVRAMELYSSQSSNVNIFKLNPIRWNAYDSNSSVEKGNSNRGSVGVGDKEDVQARIAFSFFNSLWYTFKDDLLHADWEVRHGAAVALRGFCNTLLKKCMRVTRKETSLLKVHNVIIRCLQVLSLDQFGDFQYESLIAPVRAAVSQTLSSCFKLFCNMSGEISFTNSSFVINELIQMISYSETLWNLQYSSLLALKYMLAGGSSSLLQGIFLEQSDVTLSDFDREYFLSLSKVVVPIVNNLLCHPIKVSDDILGICAEVFISIDHHAKYFLANQSTTGMDIIANSLPASDSTSLQSLINLHDNLYKLLGWLDDVSTSTKSLIELLQRIGRHLVEREADLSNIIKISGGKEIWPFFRHRISSIRSLALSYAENILKLHKYLVPNGFEQWMKIIYQIQLLDCSELVQESAGRVWKILIKIIKVGKLEGSLRAINDWMKIASTPHGQAIDADLLLIINMPAGTKLIGYKEGKSQVSSEIGNASKNPELLLEYATGNSAMLIKGANLVGEYICCCSNLYSVFFQQLDLLTNPQIGSTEILKDTWILESLCLPLVVNSILENAKLSKDGMENRQLPESVISNCVFQLKLYLTANEIRNKGLYHLLNDQTQRIHDICIDLLRDFLKTNIDLSFYEKELQQLGYVFNPNGKQIIFTANSDNSMPKEWKPSDVIERIKNHALNVTNSAIPKLLGSLSLTKGVSKKQINSWKESILIKVSDLATYIQNFECLTNISTISFATMLCSVVVTQSRVSHTSIPELNPILKPILDFLSIPNRNGVINLPNKPKVESDTVTGVSIAPLQKYIAQIVINVMEICHEKQNVIGKIIDTLFQSALNPDMRGILYCFSHLSIEYKGNILSGVPLLKQKLDTNLLDDLTNESKNSICVMNAIIASEDWAIAEYIPKVMRYLNGYWPEFKKLSTQYYTQIISTFGQKAIVILCENVIKISSVEMSRIHMMKPENEASRLSNLHAMDIIINEISNEIQHIVKSDSRKLLLLFIPAFFQAIMRASTSDPCKSVREWASKSFSRLVSLVPLVEANDYKYNFEQYMVSLGASSILIDAISTGLKFIKGLMKDPDPDEDVNPEITLADGTIVSLRPYQITGIQWLAFLAKNNVHGALCDDLGLGKSIMTLKTIEIISKKSLTNVSETTQNLGINNKASLIICPTTLVENWCSEIKKWFSVNDKYQVIGYNYCSFATKARRKSEFLKVWKQNVNSKNKKVHLIVIVSYGVVSRHRNVFKRDWEFLVLDEAHCIRNADSQTTKCVKELGPYGKHRLVITGTPVHNGVSDLWSLFDFLMPGYLGSREEFDSSIASPILAAKGKLGMDGPTQWKKAGAFLSNSYVSESQNQGSNQGNDRAIDEYTDIESLKREVVQDIDGSPQTSFAIDAKLIEKIQIEKKASAALEALHLQVLPFVLRRIKSDVLKDLPPKTIQDFVVELSEIQKMIYNDVITGTVDVSNISDADNDSANEAENDNNQQDSRSNLDDAVLKELHVFSQLKYLMKICSHPLLGLRSLYQSKLQQGASRYELQNISRKIELAKFRGYQASSKFIALCDLFESICPNDQRLSSTNSSSEYQEGNNPGESSLRHRCLLFIQSRATLDLLLELVFGLNSDSYNGEGYPLGYVKYLVLDGSVPMRQRQQVVNKFNQDESIDVLILTTNIGGQGLNLTGADVVIFLEHDWNPQNDLQAMDRAHRLGQKRSVIVYRIICAKTIEERIMNIQEFKKHIASQLVNRDGNKREHFSAVDMIDTLTNTGYTFQHSESKRIRTDDQDNNQLTKSSGSFAYSLDLVKSSLADGNTESFEMDDENDSENDDQDSDIDLVEAGAIAKDDDLDFGALSSEKKQYDQLFGLV